MRHALILAMTATCWVVPSLDPAQARAVPYHRLAKAPPADTPPARVASANAAALQEPRADAFLNANQLYPFMEGAVYRLYTAPGKVSDIALQPGESLIAISAGDTARWVIGDTLSGAGETAQVHVLVKPATAGLKSNLIVTTNRRTYHVQMESTPSTAMIAMSWSYPQDALMALKVSQARAEAAAPIATGVNIEALEFRYAISGDKPAWRPSHVFDDGQTVYIEFPKGIAQGEMPPLFVIGRDGKAELVNYRVQRNVFLVDRLFEVAELRLGGKRQTIVRITRTDLSRRSKPGVSVGAGHD